MGDAKDEGTCGTGSMVGASSSEEPGGKDGYVEADLTPARANAEDAGSTTVSGEGVTLEAEIFDVYDSTANAAVQCVMAAHSGCAQWECSACAVGHVIESRRVAPVSPPISDLDAVTIEIPNNFSANAPTAADEPPDLASLENSGPVVESHAAAAPSAKAGSSEAVLSNGQEVTIVGLVSRPDLEGQRATVRAFEDILGRYTVQVMSSDQCVCVRAALLSSWGH